MLPDVGKVNTYPGVFDAGECQPGLLSMEWYPSLFLKFFRQLIFPCRHMCSLETLGTIPTSRLVFVENIFTSLILIVALRIVECACTEVQAVPLF